MNGFFSPIVKLNQIIKKRIDKFGEQSFAFGIFGALNYPIYYIIWSLILKNSINDLHYRIIATILSVSLIFRNYWPKSCKFWFPIYWYFTLLYCIPFFFILMMFENNGAPVWLMSANAVLFLLILLVDLASYLMIFSLGILLAVLVYASHTAAPFSHITNWGGILAEGIGSVIVIFIFAYFKKQGEDNKIEVMKLVSSAIAHELRTPLNSIKFSAMGLKNYIGDIITGYKVAQQNKLEIPRVNQEVLTLIPENLDIINAETQNAFGFIDMLLMNVKQQEFNYDLKVCSIAECVGKALQRYSFKGSERNKVQFSNPAEDFKFKGNEILMIHVLFNLLKNALYYIAAKPGENSITIRLETGSPNKLYFKDTGAGIAKDVLPHIFDRFFSRTRYGTGIGLAFCKMVVETFGGRIYCHSVIGEYTEFVVELPNVS